ncbi:hypothetical protein CEXT_353141 [Caerostris extrusa]|uniref:Uncharacterized protein n=1 Tax=Caerostris extrusa TaxID=172846 RepID=A0AAV4XBY5_CAEEX|nr:hypothetical protein CEXT_353141 [Caerostris extrusa]
MNEWIVMPDLIELCWHRDILRMMQNNCFVFVTEENSLGHVRKGRLEQRRAVPSFVLMGPRSALFKAGPRQKPQSARQVPRNLGQPSLICPSTATRLFLAPVEGEEKRCQTEPTSPKVRDLEMVKDFCVVTALELIGTGSK